MSREGLHGEVGCLERNEEFGHEHVKFEKSETWKKKCQVGS